MNPLGQVKGCFIALVRKHVFVLRASDIIVQIDFVTVGVTTTKAAVTSRVLKIKTL